MWRSAILAAILVPAAGAASAQAPSGIVYSEVSLVSDYRYDGQSNSDGHATAQGYVHLWRPDGYFVGAFVTGFDIGPTPGPSWEADLYVGRNFKLGATEVGVQAMAGLYPDQPETGPGFNFVQASVRARRAWGPLSLGAQAAYTPRAAYSRRQSWRLAAEASYKAAPWLTLSANAGQKLYDGGQDRRYWDAGATLKWKALALDLRYVDTSLSRRQCFYTDWCSPAVVAKLSYSLKPLTLR